MLADPPTASDGTSVEQVFNDSVIADFNSGINGSAKGQSAGDVAKKVFTFVNGAKAFANEMESGDEVKLLRMRTKRNEIVIVPGEHIMTCK